MLGLTWHHLHVFSVVQAGAAAVSSASSNDASSSGQHPAGPTPMDTDAAIISSALGTSASGRINSDSQPAASQPNSTAADRSRQQATGQSNEGIMFSWAFSLLNVIKVFHCMLCTAF